MPYQYTDFIGVALPQAMTEDDLSTGAAASSLIAGVGGGTFDLWGNTRRWPTAHQFHHRGKYEGAAAGDVVERVTPEEIERFTPEGDMRVVQTIPLLELQLKTDALKALIGQRGALWRRRFFDGQRTWKTCRLLQVNHIETVEEAGMVSMVESAYETAMNGWHAQSASVVSQALSAGVAAVITFTNNGLLPVYDGTIKVDRTGAAITQVRVTGAGLDLTWAGTIPTAQSLTIDAGAQTVQLAPTAGGAATDAYSGFTLGAAVSDWLPIVPGVQSISVTVTGGPANLTVSYYPQWP
jgi:hypothetical protein